MTLMTSCQKTYSKRGLESWKRKMGNGPKIKTFKTSKNKIRNFNQVWHTTASVCNFGVRTECIVKTT